MKKECTILVGKSASGKTALLQELCENKNFFKLITTTTREPRIQNNEKDGVDYFFVTHNDFEKMIKESYLFEYIKFENNYYGLSKKAFENIPRDKELVVILDPEGAKNVKTIMETEGWKINTVFINESINNIIDRINTREDPIKNKKRIDNVLKNESHWPDYMKYDLVLEEDTTIEERVNKLLDYMNVKKKNKSKLRIK